VNEVREGQIRVENELFHPWHVFHVHVATTVVDFVNFYELPEVLRSELLEPSRDVYLEMQLKLRNLSKMNSTYIELFHGSFEVKIQVQQ
jgi:hypothetical protein